MLARIVVSSKPVQRKSPSEKKTENDKKILPRSVASVKISDSSIVMDMMPFDDCQKREEKPMMLQVHDDAMSGQKWRPYPIGLDQYLKDQSDRWGLPFFCRFEYLEGDGMVIPYFDYDVHMQTKPSSEIVEEHKSACEVALHKMFEQQPSFSVTDNVFMATRHGIDPKHGSWKVSFRFWVQGFKIRRLSLPDCIKQSVPHFISDDKGRHGWDLSVYSAKRNMGIPGACKGVHGDCRTMEIATGTRGPENMLNYIIQHVRGQEIELHAPRIRGRSLEVRLKGHADDGQRSNMNQHHFPSQGLELAGVADQGTQQARADADWHRVRDILCKAGFNNPSHPKRKEAGFDFFADDNKRRTCICCDLTHDSNNWYALLMSDGRLDVRNYSKHCAGTIFGEPMTNAVRLPPCQSPLHTMESSVPGADMVAPDSDVVVHTSAHPVQSSLIQWGFKAECIVVADECVEVSQHMRRCPACRAAHASPSWIISQIVRQCYSLRNSEDSCREKLISQKNGTLTLIKEDPVADAAFAELFITEHKVMGSKNGKLLHMFDGTRWVRTEMREFEGRVQHWLMGILRRLSVLLCNQQSLAIMNDESEKEDMLDSIEKAFYKARHHVLQDKGIASITKTITRMLAMTTPTKPLDSDPLLLGCDNGVIDLKTSAFRPGRPEDMVSKTVGYAFSTEADAERDAQVVLCMEQIYPVPEEREYIQRFAGYCLLGNHPEKKLLLLTDVRDGYNGKSTFQKALSTALGHNYSIVGEHAKKFCYKVERNNDSINSHDGGTLLFEGMRLMCVEELDSRRKLDCEKIKEMNGGDAGTSGRAPHDDKLRRFTWTAKMVLSFNEGKMPDFDISDGALKDRLVIMRHRSRFCTPEQMSSYGSQPYTFPVVSGVNEEANMRRWAPSMLLWLLEGLRRYWEVGLDLMPPQCREWKQHLVEEKDPVRDFLQEVRLEKTGLATDFVKSADLERDFYQTHPEMRRDRMKSLEFRKLVDRFLGADNFQEEKRVKGVKHHKVWIGWKDPRLCCSFWPSVDDGGQKDMPLNTHEGPTPAS